MIRAGNSFVAITFDVDGTVVSRAVHFGPPHDVTQEIMAGATTQRYEFGGALIALPSLTPDELQRTVSSALAVKLDRRMHTYLHPHEAAAWCRSNR